MLVIKIIPLQKSYKKQFLENTGYPLLMKFPSSAFENQGWQKPGFYEYCPAQWVLLGKPGFY